MPADHLLSRFQSYSLDCCGYTEENHSATQFVMQCTSYCSCRLVFLLCAIVTELKLPWGSNHQPRHSEAWQRVTSTSSPPYRHSGTNSPLKYLLVIEQHSTHYWVNFFCLIFIRSSLLVLYYQNREL